MSRKIAKLAVARAVYAIDRPYDYLVPQELEDRLGYEVSNRLSEIQFCYMARLVQAYYLFGLGLRQEVLSALAG